MGKSSTVVVTGFSNPKFRMPVAFKKFYLILLSFPAKINILQHCPVKLSATSQFGIRNFQQVMVPIFYL
jgi:hypothetical protein